MPVFREEGSEEWRRIIHKIDLSKIVKSEICRNTMRDGSSGHLSTPSLLTPKSSLHFFIHGPTSKIVAFLQPSRRSANPNKMSTLKDPQLFGHWKAGPLNL